MFNQFVIFYAVESPLTPRYNWNMSDLRKLHLSVFLGSVIGETQ